MWSNCYRKLPDVKSQSYQRKMPIRWLLSRPIKQLVRSLLRHLISPDKIQWPTPISLSQITSMCIKATPLDFLRSDIAMRSDRNHTLTPVYLLCPMTFGSVRPRSNNSRCLLLLPLDSATASTWFFSPIDLYPPFTWSNGWYLFRHAVSSSIAYPVHLKEEGGQYSALCAVNLQPPHSINRMAKKGKDQYRSDKHIYQLWNSLHITLHLLEKDNRAPLNVKFIH